MNFAASFGHYVFAKLCAIFKLFYLTIFHQKRIAEARHSFTSYSEIAWAQFRFHAEYKISSLFLENLYKLQCFEIFGGGKCPPAHPPWLGAWFL